jgi:hypothetical protein
MAKFVVSIETDNAAFEDAPENEIARILSELADKVEGRGMAVVTVFGSLTLRDINGNIVGKAEVVDK